MKIEADYLIIGSGIAGLFFALKAAKHGSVALVTKRERRESNTQYAQGGIAAVIGERDSFASHVEDTLSAGDGLCDRAIAEAVVLEGPEVVRELLMPCSFLADDLTAADPAKRRYSLARRSGKPAAVHVSAAAELLRQLTP